MAHGNGSMSAVLATSRHMCPEFGLYGALNGVSRERRRHLTVETDTFADCAAFCVPTVRRSSNTATPSPMGERALRTRVTLGGGSSAARRHVIWCLPETCEYGWLLLLYQ